MCKGLADIFVTLLYWWRRVEGKRKRGFSAVFTNTKGVGGGRKVREGRDTCIPVADSYGCVAEANTIL